MLPLLLFTGCLLWLLYYDRTTNPSVSAALWIVVAWGVICGSRPVTEWFSVTTAEAVRPGSIDEGNPLEGGVSLSLILMGCLVLLRRSTQWSLVIRRNAWLFVFYLFWLSSVLWSDYPLITFKRLAKDLGNVIMVLVVLTERDHYEGLKIVGRRIAYFLVPLSIVLIRYYPDWGRAYFGYDQSEVMWVGVATHKNTLGALACVGAVFLLWELLDLRHKRRQGLAKSGAIPQIVVLLMCWYLLVISHSATSLLCAGLASAMLILLHVPSVRRPPGQVEVFGLVVLLMVVAMDSFFDVKELFLTAVGRDATLTTRTVVWPVLLAYQDSPIVGPGFNTFWAGQRLVRLHTEVATIIQAHNGYLETYLNGGIVGAGLLGALLLSAYVRIRKLLVAGVPDGSIRLVFLLLAVLYNNSEASFNKNGLIWLVTLCAIMEYRSHARSRQHVSTGQSVLSPDRQAVLQNA